MKDLTDKQILDQAISEIRQWDEKRLLTDDMIGGCVSKWIDDNSGHIKRFTIITISENQWGKVDNPKISYGLMRHTGIYTNYKGISSTYLSNSSSFVISTTNLIDAQKIVKAIISSELAY